MKKYLSIVLFSLSVVFASCSNGQKQTETEVSYVLSATDFDKKMKELSAAPVLDVRTPEEFSDGHIQNALNVNWNGDDFQKEVNKIDKTKPVFVYCLSGGRSGAAASSMRSNGFTEVYELDGGMMKWRSANMPETRESTVVKSPGMTMADFEEKITSDKIVLVDFYAEWCLPCKKMKPYLEEIAKDMADKVVVVRIDADENMALCKEMNIDGLPVLQVYKNKAKTWEKQGYIEKDAVVNQLK